MLGKCAPKIIFLDLDGTLWDSLDISQLKPPFKKVNSNTIVDSKGRYVRLFNGVKNFLSWLKAEGLKVVALSWNIYEIALEALKTFNILKFFDKLYIEYHPRKDLLMKRALKEFSSELGMEIKPCHVIYIDDRDIHINDITSNVGDVFFIKMWDHVKDYNELKELIKSKLRVNKVREGEIHD